MTPHVSCGVCVVRAVSASSSWCLAGHAAPSPAQQQTVPVMQVGTEDAELPPGQAEVEREIACCLLQVRAWLQLTRECRAFWPASRIYDLSTLCMTQSRLNQELKSLTTITHQGVTASGLVCLSQVVYDGSPVVRCEAALGIVRLMAAPAHSVLFQVSSLNLLATCS